MLKAIVINGAELQELTNRTLTEVGIGNAAADGRLTDAQRETLRTIHRDWLLMRRTVSDPVLATNIDGIIGSIATLLYCDEIARRTPSVHVDREAN